MTELQSEVKNAANNSGDRSSSRRHHSSKRGSSHNNNQSPKSHKRTRRRRSGPGLGHHITNFIFGLVSRLIRYVFQFIYGVKGQSQPAITDPILLESATSLARKIRKQELSSVQVLESFIKRIQEVNPLLNCVVDERYADARKEAAAADLLIRSGQYSEEELTHFKPFLGVPISTKDCIAVKGMLNTSGLYARKDVRAKEDADAIALMREAGAIPFALTNVSEVCMWWESNNTVHGRTRNPYDTNRIVGGSSGGEGCIQAAAASPFGIGSDIGGSIRMPSFFNGVFGHKPTCNVVSNRGQFPCPFSEEQNSFLGIGPIVRYAEDLKPVFKIIAGEKNAPELKLDEPVDVKKLRFFYQEDDGGGRLVSPVDDDQRAALQRVVQHLQNNLKVPVDKLHLEKLRQSAIIWFANMKDNTGHGFDYQLGNLEKPINTTMELLKWFVGLSKHTLIGLSTAIMDKSQVQHGSSKYHHMVKKRDELRAELQELLGDDGVFLYPTHPTVAPYHNEPILRPINFSYTGIINVLGFPATAVPLGLGSEGLPLGIQVVANFKQDRLCFAVAEELEKAFGGWTRPQVNLK